MVLIINKQNCTKRNGGWEEEKERKEKTVSVETPCLEALNMTLAEDLL